MYGFNNNSSNNGIICKFWAQGTCAKGNNCKFKHIGPPGKQQSFGNTFGSNNNVSEISFTMNIC